MNPFSYIKALATKPDPPRRYFITSFANTHFNTPFHSKFVKNLNTKISQPKFEIENALKRFYLRPEINNNFVFQVVNKKDLKNIFFNIASAYLDLTEYSTHNHYIYSFRNTLRPQYVLIKILGPRKFINFIRLHCCVHILIH